MTTISEIKHKTDQTILVNETHTESVFNLNLTLSQDKITGSHPARPLSDS